MNITEETNDYFSTTEKSVEVAQDVMIDKDITEEQWLKFINKYAKPRPLQRKFLKSCRNTLCSCGSGKKVKKCCGIPPMEYTSAFNYNDK